jgi:drug/metabolite transporter (DMT)-like permease
VSARLLTLTVLAVLAFTANPLLARLALVTSEMDALGYTGVRLASGALVLWALLFWRDGRAPRTVGGTWAGAAALFGYAILFSIAFLLIGAAVGALILFGAVQIAILSWAILKGDRPGALEWTGLAMAGASLLYLVSPGLVAPHPIGAALMVVSGISWAAYTLIGRGSREPLRDTAGNFIRLLPLSLPLVVAGLAMQAPTALGLVYAIASGAVSSALGYAIWYAVLPQMSRSVSAFVQLTVPALAALGSVVWLAEPLTLRLVLASAGILGGAALALWAAGRRARRT